jgi:hypothetical protein
MTRGWTILCAVGLASAALADFQEDQRLLARAPARQVVAAPQSADANAAAKATADDPRAPHGDLAQEEREARSAAALSQARLELVLARKALRGGQSARAIEKADRALALLRQVAPATDVSELELQAEGIKAVATRAAGDAASPPVRDAPVTAGDMPDSAQAPSPAQAPPSEQEPAAPPRLVRSPTGDEYSYRPRSTVINVDAVLSGENEQLRYQGAVDTQVRADDVRRLTETEESRLGPDNIVTYPENWPEIVRKRARYSDGVVARTPSWTDKDGREWYIAIYDIRDLTYEPPDFGGGPVDLYEEVNYNLDRQALRDYSWIFRGDAQDFANGIPLLRYFGGYRDNYGFSDYYGASNGGRYSLQRQQAIIDMIKAFTGMKEDAGPGQPYVVPVPQP